MLPLLHIAHGLLVGDLLVPRDLVLAPVAAAGALVQLALARPGGLGVGEQLCDVQNKSKASVPSSVMGCGTLCVQVW